MDVCKRSTRLIFGVAFFAVLGSSFVVVPRQSQQSEQRTRRQLIEDTSRHEDDPFEQQAEDRFPSIVPVSTPQPTTEAPVEDPFITEEALSRHTDDEGDNGAREVQPGIPIERHEDDPNEMNVNAAVPDNTTSPTKAPTTSSAPTTSPAPSLSEAPSQAPSLGPSNPVPSLTPSGFSLQDIEPSVGPSGLASSAPSSTPSTEASSTPSQVASSTPTTSPSAMPSFDCTSDAATGLFGTVSANATIVNFTYEIEFIPDVNLSDIFPDLEVAITDSIVPTLFAATCGNGTALAAVNTTRRLMRTRRLKVVGISMQPDEVVTQESCETVENASNTCNVVEGAFTLYSDPPENGEDKAALATIRSDMNSGRYNDVHPSIVALRYIDRLPSSGTGTGDGMRDNRGTSRLPVWAYVLIAISALFLIGVAIFAYRRRRRRGYDDDSVRGDSAVDQEDYQPPDTISALTPP